jgi:short-subunit dehydrogenase
MDLDGATCLVTGANRGVGLAISRALARRPVRLLAGVRDVERYEPIDAGPGGAREVRPVKMDLSSRESIEESCAALGEELATIDLLVNNAGLMTGGLLEEQDVDAVYAMFQVNLLAVAHLTHRVLPGMLGRGRGKIVNNASISGYAYFPAATTYAASKAGVVALTEALRRELAGTGVTTVHLVTPGVQTDMLADTEQVYGRHMDTSAWDRVPAEEWAARVVRAIESDANVLMPGGKSGWAVRAAHGPAFLLDAFAKRTFSRTPRR